MSEPLFTISTAFINEEAIRQDERKRLADLLTEHADLLGEYAADTVAAVRLVALLVGLNAS